MTSPTPRFRVATPADAEVLSHAGADAMAGYTAFAPAGWAPPPVAAEIEHTRALLGDDEVWCLVAESGGDVVGQITVLPAARSAHKVDEPGLAHLRNLFVREDHWGTGLAAELHARALRTATDRGFAAIRLFVAADHPRARRFYERGGWSPVSEACFDPGIGLAIVEYRRALP